MPKATSHPTSPIAAVQTPTATRRALLKIGAALAAIPTIAVAEAEHAPITEPPAEPIATIEDMAALEFHDESPAIEAALGTFDDWMAAAPEKYFVAQVATKIVRRDPGGVVSTVREVGENAAFDCADGLLDAHNYYTALAGLCMGASVRVQAGLSRVALAEGGAAWAP